MIEGYLTAKIGASRRGGSHHRLIGVGRRGGVGATTAGGQQSTQRHARNANTGIPQGGSSAQTGRGTGGLPGGMGEKCHGVPFA